MAGGMTPKTGGWTLAERSARAQHQNPAGAGAAPAAAGARHCWVTGLAERPGRWPGLLVSWDRQHGQWLGRVVYAVVDDGQVVLVEAWVPGRYLEPVEIRT